MLILPSKTDFIENAKRGKIYPVYTELPFMSPQKVYESIKGPYSFLLESIKGPEKIARYSFAGENPFLIFKVKNGTAEIQYRIQNSKFGIRNKSRRILSKTPLKKLKEILTEFKIEQTEGLPPFLGGAVGMINYDFVHYFERLPNTAVDDLHIPDAHFLFIDTFAAFDHKLKKTFIISCPGAQEKVQKFKSSNFKMLNPKSETCLPCLPDSQASGKVLNSQFSWGDYYDTACEKIKSIYKKISSIPHTTLLTKGSRRDSLTTFLKRPVEIRHELSKKAYMDIVIKAKEYIRAGDIFQANLSQRVSACIGKTDPWDIYKILSRINPSPFAAYLDMGDYHIVSSSPERLLKYYGSTVETRPIAGTRPRGVDEKGDRQMRTDLLMNEKERAEHLMLIDLERNDLGKISDYGSVIVDEFMITEDYSHVIHIVSNIKGTVAGGKDCFDALRAAFPGGTITGVPKIRCMEIIDELEPVTRGPYTGSLGYISFTGAMDLNIIIRTFVIKNDIAYVQAGAGIVADSEPEKEYYETLKKAEALIKTLEML